MSTFRHGVYITEVPPETVPVLDVSASLPVIVGTAPVGMVTDGVASTINKPIVCRSFTEFREAFGYVGPVNGAFEFSLCEFAYAYYQLYGGRDAVFINVLGAESGHTKTVTAEAGKIENGEAAVTGKTGIIGSTIVVKSTGGSPTTYVEGTDYTVTYNAAGAPVISIVAGGAMTEGEDIAVDYSYLDASAVVKADVIGGEDPATLKATGLQLIDAVLPTTQLVPGLIVAPGHSADPEVAAVMDVKAKNINANYRAMAVVDISTEASPAGAPRYTDIGAYKLLNNLTSKHMIACWPKCVAYGTTYWLSTHAACVIARTDSENGGVPYVSPSNEPIQITGLVDAAGNDVILDQVRANVVNSTGTVTALNSQSGWTAWGNETCAFPVETSAPDRFISVRRMFNFVGNTIVSNNRRFLDSPLNTRSIQSVLSTNNSWISGLVGAGALVGGRVEFLEADNPLTKLESGEAYFRVYLTPPSPMAVLEFGLRYDASALATLFG